MHGQPEGLSPGALFPHGAALKDSGAADRQGAWPGRWPNNPAEELPPPSRDWLESA